MFQVKGQILGKNNGNRGTTIKNILSLNQFIVNLVYFIFTKFQFHQGRVQEICTGSIQSQTQKVVTVSMKHQTPTTITRCTKR
jgi:hypothetical protein